MNHKVAAHGKQLKVNGQHWADCNSEDRARTIARALENYFASKVLTP